MPGAAITPRGSSSSVIRAARPEDLPAIAALQRSSPEAAPWDPAGYEILVAELDSRVVGFLVSRTITDGEREILNLAVAPQYRRRGIARSLVLPVLCGTVFLEVRESNSAALALYNSLGFQELTRRRGYYTDPPEGAIVLKFLSC